MPRMITLKSGKQVSASLVGKPYTAANGYSYQINEDGSVKRLGRAKSNSGSNGDKLIRRATAEDLRTLPRGKPTGSAPAKSRSGKKTGGKASTPRAASARPGISAADSNRLRNSGSSARPAATPRKSSGENFGVPTSAYGPNSAARLAAGVKSSGENFGIPQSAYKVKPPKVRTPVPANLSEAERNRLRNSGGTRKKKPVQTKSSGENFGIPLSAYKRK